MDAGYSRVSVNYSTGSLFQLLGYAFNRPSCRYFFYSIRRHPVETSRATGKVHPKDSDAPWMPIMPFGGHSGVARRAMVREDAASRAYSASAAFLRPRFFIVPALASATAKMMALSSGWPMPGMER